MCDRSTILVLNCDLLNIQALDASVVLPLHRHISKALAYVKLPLYPVNEALSEGRIGDDS